LSLEASSSPISSMGPTTGPPLLPTTTGGQSSSFPVNPTIEASSFASSITASTSTSSHIATSSPVPVGGIVGGVIAGAIVMTAIIAAAVAWYKLRIRRLQENAPARQLYPRPEQAEMTTDPRTDGIEKAAPESRDLRYDF
jgi:hypothetical protein